MRQCSAELVDRTETLRERLNLGGRSDQKEVAATSLLDGVFENNVQTAS